MSCYFRRDEARIPERFKGQKVALRAYFSGDGLLRVNGKAYHGLDPFRDTVFMSDCATGEESYDLEVESYIAWHFGEGTVKTVESSEWVVLDSEMEEAYWDIRAAFNLLITEGLPSDLTAYLRDALHKATKPIEQECTDPVRVKKMAMAAQAMIKEKVYDCDKFKREGLLHLCGNSHLDLVYLWNHAEYERKIGRTHATALRMMEEYPEYIFSQSQPQMYDRMREIYPEIYEQVKERVAEGRWEPIGAFWVEPDCNLISGESMVRQLVYGIRYFQKEFGVTPRTAWIPDVFGNAWSMPQILVKAGLKYFVTHKMNVWNDTNKWTHHTFWWEGPDGSKIFSTVPPTHFVGTCEPDHLNDHWDNYSAKAEVPESLYCYGWGDGGGGPDREMLEYCKRYRDIPGVVPGRFSKIEDALERMCTLAEARNDIPVINDELYLEEHRGVYTTKGRLKKLHRRTELGLRKAEMFSIFSEGEYPSDGLDQAWKTFLTTQFHDSLPGTHTTQAYADLMDMFVDVTSCVNSAISCAYRSIAGCADEKDDGQTVVLFNAQPFARESMATVSFSRQGSVHIIGPDGAEVPSQLTTDFESGAPVLAFNAKVPSCGYATYRIVDGAGELNRNSHVEETGHQLENGYLRVTFNAYGEIVSLYDKQADCECIGDGQRGNLFQLFEDMPGTFDAWDIEMHYEDTEFELEAGSIECSESGPVFSALTLRKNILGSPLTQRIVLAHKSKRLEFQTRVDWKERHKLLKVRFNTNIRSRQATYDIPFANIERPTSRNNSYESAKFEVCGHQWMDLSQPDHGLSLLTDCKYGYECKDQQMGLTLLKGPMYPDPVSDIEEHTFTYAIYPHGGGWREAGTIEEAADLNDALDVLISDNAPEDSLQGSFLTIDQSGVTLESVKKPEEGDGVVVRLVERHGRNVNVSMNCHNKIRSASECDLLENAETDVAVDDGMLSLSLSPYEIKTIRLLMA